MLGDYTASSTASEDARPKSGLIFVNHSNGLPVLPSATKSVFVRRCPTPKKNAAFLPHINIYKESKLKCDCESP